MQQLKEFLNLPTNKFTLNVWYNLIFTDVLKSEKRIIQVRKIKDINIMTANSVMSFLKEYYNKIEQDIRISPNNICKKGCYNCCTSDFEVSIAEYFAILKYIGVKFGKNAIIDISKQAKLSLSSPRCIFIDNTNGSCKIYEVRPLICRKYGLYAEDTDCKKLSTSDMLQTSIKTTENTNLFKNEKLFHGSMICETKRLVHWFANMENGDLSSQRMKDLFYSAFNQSVDEFVEILVK